MSKTPARPRRRTRVAIIDDHELFAEALELAHTVRGYDVRRFDPPGAARSPEALLAAVARFAPRVVLLDLHLGEFGDSSRLIKPLAAGGANVVVVTASPDHAQWGACLHRGARKVMSKTRPLNDVLSVVRRLSQGLPVQDRAEREDLLAHWHTAEESDRLARERLEELTARERVVLTHLMEGTVVHDIARIDVVSEGTVRTQVKSILSKLDVSSQLAAVGLAHRVGWHAPQMAGSAT